MSEIGLAEAEHGERGERPQREGAWRVTSAPAHALHVRPHRAEHRERQADVQEDEEREEAVAHLVARR